MSPARAPLTVVVLTLDEEENLPHALRSVLGWAQDVVVVDSGSTDGTRAIAESAGVRWEAHPFEDYSKQRNFALRGIPLHTEWVLFLDADEWVPVDLREEIAGILSRQPAENGFLLTFRLVWMGKVIRFGYRPAQLLRLVRHRFARCDDRGMNEHLSVEGKTGSVKAPFVHEDRKGLSAWIEKHNRYASREAALLATAGAAESEENGRFFGRRADRTRWIRTRIWRRLPPLVRPWLYFVFRFVLMGGFLDGRAGFSFHFLQALWYQSLIDMKFLERRVR